MSTKFSQIGSFKFSVAVDVMSTMLDRVGMIPPYLQDEREHWTDNS